jgi:hypothetical protein
LRRLLISFFEGRKVRVLTVGREWERREHGGGFKFVRGQSTEIFFQVKLVAIRWVSVRSDPQ